jgi:hypothetical protein
MLFAPCVVPCGCAILRHSIAATTMSDDTCEQAADGAAACGGTSISSRCLNTFRSLLAGMRDEAIARQRSPNAYTSPAECYSDGNMLNCRH